METRRVERRLSAVLAADVVGYSRLVGIDEEGTLERLRSIRLELIDPAIAVHRGRIIKTAGDGILVEFPSVVDVVRCALAVQRSMAERNAEIAAHRLIAFRIGIHLGDVVVDGADLLGDGVNIAARLEGVADPGGISLSEDVWRQIRDKLPEAFVDLRELGVRYVLEGSLRKGGNRLRITGQLIEAETGTHVWADKYDGVLEDVFDLQDKITETIVGIIEPSVRRAEIERSRRKRPENLGAYALYLRALPHTQSAMPEDAAIAIGYLEEALELDPNYAVAHAALAVCRESRFRGAGFGEVDRTEGVRHARLALALGTDDATALAYAALTVLHLAHDFEAASGAIARALSLNGSCATPLYWAAHLSAWSADPVLAEDYANRALRLSPFDPLSYEGYVALGAVRLRLRRYDDAAACLAKAVQANPRFSVLYALQASALAMAGRIEEANALARRLLELEPTFRAIRFLEFAGFVKPEIREAFAAAFREAGLPE